MNSYTRGALAAVVVTLIACVGSARGQMMGYAPQPGYGYGGGQPPMYRDAAPQMGPQYTPAQMVGNAGSSDPSYQMAPGGAAGEAAMPQGGDGAQDGEGACPALPPGTGYCPRWTATADGLWMTRWGGHSEPLIVGTANGADLVNTTGLPFNIAGGPRADVIYHCDSKWEIEFSGFLIDGFHAMDSEFGAVTFNNAGIIATDPTSMTFDYVSRMYSLEINLRRPVSNNVTLFVGARWIELQEQLTGSDTAGTFLTVNSNNHMYGLQAGMDATLWAPSPCSPFRIDGMVKAGVYDNRGDQYSSGTTAAGGTANAGAFDDHVAFLGEASLTACYQLSKHVASRIGCEAAWLQSVALAPNQLMTTNLTAGTATVDMSGGLFFLGGFAGLEVDY